MINYKNAKEVKKQVEEITKNRTKCTKNENNPQKKGDISKKTTKKTAKNKKQSRFKTFLILSSFWVFEILVCAVVVVTAWCINTIEAYVEVFDVVHQQQDLIEQLIEEKKTEPQTVSAKTLATEEKKLAYNLTTEERELLAKLLYHEARGESIDCQKAVVSVILNRVESGIWGDTLEEVVYSKNQFEPVARGLLPNTKPLEKQYEAIDYVIANGATVPSNVLYFRADHYFDWGTAYMNMDNTYFSF